MKKLVLIAFLVFLFLDSFSQGFEGIITYSMSIENAKPESISEEQFKMMFQGMDTSAILYLKGHQYKFVTINHLTKEPRTVELYVPDSSKIYQYMDGQDELCMWSDAEINHEQKVKINNVKPLLIMGKPTQSITIDYGTHQTIVYFSNEWSVDPDQYKDFAFSFLGYINYSKALPLKIVLKGGGAIHNSIFTATKIEEVELDDKELALPKFKDMMKNPFIDFYKDK